MKIKQTLLAVIICLAVMPLFIQPGNIQADTDCPDCRQYRLDGCTVIIVGKDASTDGSVMTTHTCDCGLCDWTFRYIPAAQHDEDTMRKIYHINQFQTWPPKEGLKWEIIKKEFTGLEIPQPKKTHGYLHGAFGYMNDVQVAIGESTIGTREKMENPTPAAKFDITMLTLLAMEQAGTAREAVKIMGEMGEKHGYGFTDTGEMLALSDPNEVWVFEIMPVGPLWSPKSGKPGAVWCAQRVPDDHVSVCPNESRIGEIDLDNPDYFMASSNVISYAVEKGYYDPDGGKPFNWKRAYSPSKTSAAASKGSRARLWRFMDLMAPSRNFKPETPNMDLPFTVKPDKKLSVHDVMVMTRDKFQGTPYYTARGLQGGPWENPNRLPYGFQLEGEKYNTSRMIGVNRAEYVTVTQCRDWLPDPVGGLVWLCFGAQDTSCYMPFYAGCTAIPGSFEIGDHWTFDRGSARWAFDYVDFHTQVAYSLAIEDVGAAQDRWEKSAVERTPIIDTFAAELYKKDPKMMEDFLTDYCNNNANRVVDAWWKLGDDLLVRFNKLWDYDVKTRKRNALKYPDWWLKLLVEYNKLTPEAKK